jgi:ubiquinol-cytochrome c reductase cytochrome c1 subunit
MSMSKSMTKLAIGLIAAGALLTGGATLAESNAAPLVQPPHPFTFDGPFGTFDQAQLQRGYKVYREVCSTCHAMHLMSFRNLGQKGGPFYDPKYKNPNDNPVVKEIASEYDIADIDPDTGDDITRKGTPADRFPSPFKNDEAAKASNNGAIPPDMSVLAKAREGGALYIYNIVSGSHTPPAGLELNPGQYYYPHVNGSLRAQWKGDPAHVPHGGVLAMPPPLKSNGQVAYDDGTPSTVQQNAEDVAAFLAWASDPHAVERKQTGFAVIIYLLLLAGLTYAAYRQVWRGKH